MEEKSKSLNELIKTLPEIDQKLIKKWWRTKLLLAFYMSGLTAVIGFIAGFVLPNTIVCGTH